MRIDTSGRRQRIIDAAIHEVTAKGSRFQLGDVAERAGVGVATLYRNFPTRNALILEVSSHLVERVCEQLDRAVGYLRVSEGTEKEILWEVVKECVPAGVNVLVPLLIEVDEELLPADLIEVRRRFLSSLDLFMSSVRECGLIHETVTDQWVLNGLIQLYQPSCFSFLEGQEVFKARDSLAAVFLEGCERGLDQSEFVKGMGS